MSQSERPVFIVCAPRSGSTLLRLILDAHPHLAVPPPAWLYELIRPYVYSYGDLASDENFLELCEDMLATPTIKRWQLGIDAAALMQASPSRSFAGPYEALHVAYAEKTGKPRWGEKTLRNSFWIDEIKQDFPDAQIVHIVRDGRDMAIDIADSPQMRPFTVFMGAHYWKNYVSAIQESASRLDAADYYEIKYEALCADPPAELRKLCAFLGEDFDDAMLSHQTSGGTRNWSSDPQHAKTARPITTDYCEMYRHRLPAADVAVLESIFGDLLKAFGYPTSAVDTGLSERAALQMLQSDLVSSPENYEFKAWHVKRRNERRERGVYNTQDRPSLLWSLQ